MGKANVQIVEDGDSFWERTVPAVYGPRPGAVWRTDVYPLVYGDETVVYARFLLAGGGRPFVCQWRSCAGRSRASGRELAGVSAFSTSSPRRS